MKVSLKTVNCSGTFRGCWKSCNYINNNLKERYHGQKKYSCLKDEKNIQRSFKNWEQEANGINRIATDNKLNIIKEQHQTPYMQAFIHHNCTWRHWKSRSVSQILVETKDTEVCKHPLNATARSESATKACASPWFDQMTYQQATKSSAVSSAVCQM